MVGNFVTNLSVYFTGAPYTWRSSPSRLEMMYIKICKEYWDPRWTILHCIGKIVKLLQTDHFYWLIHSAITMDQQRLIPNIKMLKFSWKTTKFFFKSGNCAKAFPTVKHVSLFSHSFMIVRSVSLHSIQSIQSLLSECFKQFFKVYKLQSIQYVHNGPSYWPSF